MKPIYIHSGMAGSPQYANADGAINAILEACLVNGFNTRTASSATAGAGVLTLNFASDPGFEPLQTVEVAVANVPLVNGVHRVLANANNQVTIAIAGLGDGAVGSSGAGITIKQASAGWGRPYSSTTTAVFRAPAGTSGNRHYLRCVHAQGQDMSAKAYEDMTDLSTGVGEYPNASLSSTSTAIYTASHNVRANAPWFCIATDKWLVFSLANNLVVSYPVGTLIFGDLAGQVKAADAFASILTNTSSAYMARNYAGAVGGISAYKVVNNSSAVWPSVIDDGLRFIPYVPVTEASGVLRGVMPNSYNIHPAPPPSHFLDVYENITGITGRVKPISDVMGNQLKIGIAIDEDAWA
jgi:hypothetical protein